MIETGTTHSYFQAFPSKLTLNTKKILLRVGANFNISVVKWGLEKLAWKSRILSTLFHWLYLKTSILWMNSQILKCRFEWFSVLCSREEEPCQVRFRRTDQAATRPWTDLPCFTPAWRKWSVNRVCLQHWPAPCHGTPLTRQGVWTVRITNTLSQTSKCCICLWHA